MRAAHAGVLALIHAELGGAYPVAGGSMRFPHYAFGGLIGFASGWVAWLGSVTVAPIEVEAALQYFTHYVPWLTKTTGGQTVLTAQGYAVAVVLMALFTAVNVLGVRFLARANNVIMVWKVAIPVLAIVALAVTRFHGANFHAEGGFNPFGWHGIFSAISTGGVIFAYLGFEQAVQLGGEGANPRRNIPLAVVGAMVIGVAVYILLQVVFIGALNPQDLSHGWGKLAFNGLAGPFAGLATAVGLGWLATLLYVDAAVSPGGTGLIYVASSSRLSYALSREGYIWSPFHWLNSRRVPIVGIVLTFVVGVILFLPFPGWQKFVGFITSATVLSYALVPPAMAALRRQDRDRDRPFRLPVADLIAPIGFVVANLIVYWSGWDVDRRLFIAIAIGFLVLGLSQLTMPRVQRPERFDWRAAIWFPPYIAGMAVISWLGQYNGRGAIPFWWDIVVVAAFSIAIYAIALSVRLRPERTQELIGDLTAEAEEERAELGDAPAH